MWSGVSSVRVGRESSGGGMGGKWKWARKLPKCLNFLASFFAAIALWSFPEIGLTDVVDQIHLQLTHTAARKAKQKHTAFWENCSFALSEYVKYYFFKLVMSKLGVCRQVFISLWLFLITNATHLPCHWGGTALLSWAKLNCSYLCSSS